MKIRPVIIILNIALVGVLVGAQPSGGLPQDHPSMVKPAPNDPTMVPTAHEADVGSLDQIVRAYFDSMSAGPGEPRDWQRFKSLFMPGARMLAARASADGGAGVWPLSVDDYVEANQKYFEKGGYIEKEIARRVETFGNIAQVWSTYEARRSENEPEPYARGIYSMHLLRGGTRWWIVDMYWDYERPDTPIPEKYLGQDADQTP